MSLAAAIALVMRKDLLLEWRTRARLNSLVFFALATLMLLSFSLGADNKLLQRHAPGYLWLALLFASVLALGESFAVERENQALEGLRLLPVPPEAIFIGKALGMTATLVLIGAVLIVAMMAMFDVPIALGPVPLIYTLLLGAGAVSAPGTALAAMAANTRARDVLLPLMMFPLLVPALLGLVRATTLVSQGDPMGELRSWIGLLIAFNVIYWALGALLFRALLEE